jgi:hypothetical protein
MDERVGDILQSALRAADARGVGRPRLGDLSVDERDHLAQATLEFLVSRPHTPSPYPGWVQVKGFDAGVLRWWNDHLGGPFPSPVTQRLQTLREQIYDFLDGLGRIVKEPGQASPVHVAPLARSWNDQEELHQRTIHISRSGAGFGDAETNRLVEAAAMRAAVDYYSEWDHKDVSHTNCGWDITFYRGADELHVEVKGVSGQKPKVLLTRNEVNIAQTDSNWTLLVVTRALVSPDARQVERDIVLAVVEPFVYVADLA